MITTRVLVVYASRHGATQGIAERIATTLAQYGLEVTVGPVESAVDPADYDAVVIGSAAYFFRWMKKARQFVRRNRAVLAERPVWLFSSGPLGTEANDDKGRDKRTVTVPKEIAEFIEAIHPRDHRVFFGALIPSKLGFIHGLIFKMPANRDHAILPEGDFRDWNDIEHWAREIAQSLKATADGAVAAEVHDGGILVA